MLTRTRKSRPRAFIDPFTKTEIKRLVAEFGSPLLIIDCQRVREQYRKLHKAVPGVERTETIIVLSSLKETAQIPTREPEWMS